MLEKTIRKEMIKRLPEDKILLQPIESGNTGIGILDIFYRSLHQDGWIEFKVIKNYPKRSRFIKIPWRPGQMNWIRRYRELNGNVFLFLYIENALWILRDFCILKQYTEPKLLELSCYREFWKELNWNKIYAILNSGI